MQTIYLITGPAGVGKSTISKLVAKRLEKSVLIEGDNVYNIVVGGRVSPWKEGNQLGLFWKNSKDMINNSLNEGFDVVFNYILDKTQIKDIKDSFPKVKVKFACLLVDEKTLIERDKLRPKDSQMGERCLVLLKDFKDKNFADNYIIDSSNLTPDETANMIIKDDRFILS